MRARSALFTLFGDVVRPAGGEAWLSTLTACMEALGFTAEATRTALHRMSGEGWVEPRRLGRYACYRLTPQGLERLEEAAARIYRLRAADWDGRWRILVCPPAGRVPQLVRALHWLGFGRLSTDVWISPHDHGERARDVLVAHDLHAPAWQFDADADARQDAATVATAWDLSALRDAHRQFVERWRGVTPATEARAAFITRIELVHDWRSFLFLDPGLPAALLPDDWLGAEAAETFRALYEAVAEPAWAFYDALTETAPATATNGAPPAIGARRQPDASPFARGLAALSARRP